MAIEFNVDSQVRPYATLSAFPTTGAVKTIYVALDTKLIYVYDSGSYTEIGDSISAEWGHINGDITSQVDLQTALNAKFDNPIGNSTQYLDGAGTPTTFPAFASADKMVTVGRNSTGSTLYKGTIVYISGSTGNRPNFVKAQANSEATSAGTFGVIEADIANNADGNCVTIGTIDNLDTRSSAPHPFTSDTLADGDTIYLSPTTAGYITNVKPYAPSHLVYVGKVVRTSPTNGTIVYRIQNGYELDELHDVAAQTPSNNDALAFETSTQLWKPKSITTLLGFTPVPTSRTLTINGTTQDLSADRTFTISTGITIGTTAITSGTVGRVLFEGTGNVVQESANLFWDNTNARLDVLGSMKIASATSGMIIRDWTAFNTFRAIYKASETPSNTNYLMAFDTDVLLNSRGSGTDIYYNGSIRARFGNAFALRVIGSGTTTATIGMEVTSSTNTNLFQIRDNGAVLINTTTDAGFKLDVNGTARVSGQVDLAGLTNTQIVTSQQGNSRLLQFNNNGAAGGWGGGYVFSAGSNNVYGNTTAFRIWQGGRIGVGDISDANIQGGNAQVYINNQITGGRNAGVRISPSAVSSTQFNGIQFDYNNKDSGGGAFLGSQYNPLSNGYDMDLVVITSGAIVNTYSETARFMGKYNSFYVGTDKTLAVPSAKMQVESTTQGFLPPRQTQAQRTAIASPAVGLQVYQTDGTEGLYIYKSTGWALLL